MAYQFVHVETYARSAKGKNRTARGVVNEASRVDDAAPHVPSPQPPLLLRGPMPTDWLDDIEEQAAEAKDSIGRKLRKDAHIIIAGVASYPVQCADLDDQERERMMEWAEKTMDWFAKEHGGIQSAVMHLDERFPHIHMYNAPDLVNGQRVADLHCGEQAKKQAEAEHARRYQADKAKPKTEREGIKKYMKLREKKQVFREAMEGYQDRYFEEVAASFGMARTGPGRRRMERHEWQAEQKQLALYAEREKAVDTKYEAATHEAGEIVSQAKETASQTIKDAHNQVADLRKKLASKSRHIAQQEKVIDQRETKLGSLEKSLSKKQNQIKTKEKDLAARQKAVAAREKRLAGAWGTIVSIFTLGKKGTSQAVKKAVEEEKRKADAEMQKLREEADKIKKQRDRQTEKLSVSQSTLQRRAKTENTQRQQIKQLEQQLEQAQKAVETAKDQSQLHAVMAEKATSDRDLRVMKAGLADLKDAFDSGDIDRLEKGLIKLTKTERPKTPEKPSRPRIDWDDDYDSDRPGLG